MPKRKRCIDDESSNIAQEYLGFEEVFFDLNTGKFFTEDQILSDAQTDFIFLELNLQTQQQQQTKQIPSEFIVIEDDLPLKKPPQKKHKPSFKFIDETPAFIFTDGSQ